MWEKITSFSLHGKEEWHLLKEYDCSKYVNFVNYNVNLPLTLSKNNYA